MYDRSDHMMIGLCTLYQSRATIGIKILCLPDQHSYKPSLMIQAAFSSKIYFTLPTAAIFQSLLLKREPFPIQPIIICQFFFRLFSWFPTFSPYYYIESVCLTVSQKTKYFLQCIMEGTLCLNNVIYKSRNGCIPHGIYYL